jgi:hypothetical protein
MSRDEYERNKPIIENDVRAILTAKGKSRGRFRFVAAYERQTGDLLAEVMHTSKGLAVVIYHGQGFRVEPLTGPGQRFHLRTRQGQPALEFFNVGPDASPYWLDGEHFIARTSPNDALVLR